MQAPELPLPYFGCLPMPPFSSSALLPPGGAPWQERRLHWKPTESHHHQWPHKWNICLGKPCQLPPNFGSFLLSTCQLAGRSPIPGNFIQIGWKIKLLQMNLCFTNKLMECKKWINETQPAMRTPTSYLTPEALPLSPLPHWTSRATQESSEKRVSWLGWQKTEQEMEEGWIPLTHPTFLISPAPLSTWLGSLYIQILGIAFMYSLALRNMAFFNGVIPCLYWFLNCQNDKLNWYYLT